MIGALVALEVLKSISHFVLLPLPVFFHALPHGFSYNLLGFSSIPFDLIIGKVHDLMVDRSMERLGC